MPKSCRIFSRWREACSRNSVFCGIFEEAGQGVVVGLVEKLDLPVLFPRRMEFLEGGDHLRLVEFGLLQKRSGHAEGDLESRTGRDQFREHPCRRQIAFLGNLEEDLPVLLLPEELVPVRMEPERLVELKVKRDERHIHLAGENSPVCSI